MSGALCGVGTCFNGIGLWNCGFPSHRLSMFMTVDNPPYAPPTTNILGELAPVGPVKAWLVGEFSFKLLVGARWAFGCF